MAVMSSPWKSAVDSPSRQLLWELSRLGVASQESFYARLDRENHEREIVHKQALAAAAAEHNRIRESAELVRKELEQQVQNERRKRDEEQRRELERRRQEQVEREIEEKKLLEKEKAKTAELEAKKAEQTERIRRAEAEAAAHQKAEKDRQSSEAAARAQKEKQNVEVQRRLAEPKAAQQTPAPATERTPAATSSAPPPAITAPSSSVPAQPTRNPEREAEHERYLEIHKRLKELRSFMKAEGDKSPDLKTNMGNMRREIRKSVGQLRAGHGANKTPLQNIINTLRSALKIPSPQIPISSFLFSPPTLLEGTPTTGPSLLLYLLNIFSKAIIAQLVSEAGVEPAKADPIGTIASHIFALGDFLWNGLTLIDILIAKYHVTCPVLFGVYGPENTNAGKERLGWVREESNGPFVSLQHHNQRMTGLGAGFAGISLRNYEKSVHKNPYPATNYWIAFSNIVNVPAGQRTDTHAMVLKAMIEGYEERFLLFFGDAARVALRLAVVDFPKGVRDAGIGTRALGLLEDVMLRERKIRI